MSPDEILRLGIGIEPPWKLVGQRLDTSKRPHELHLQVEPERGAPYFCPQCRESCPTHDFREKTWRHLNFFQYPCYITAPVPRVKCPRHGVVQLIVPWVRTGTDFTLWFERRVLALVREKSVRAAARLAGITDTRLWRIVRHYVQQPTRNRDFSTIRGVGIAESAGSRGRHRVTAFFDMDRNQEPVLFVTQGHGKETVLRFAAFLSEHGGAVGQIREVACDMSPALVQAVSELIPNAVITVDWFHIVDVFTESVERVRKLECNERPSPENLQCALRKPGAFTQLTTDERAAIAELISQTSDTATAWRIKEKLSWVRQAPTPCEARWRITRFLGWAEVLVSGTPRLEPVRQALDTLAAQSDCLVQRWASTHTSALFELLNDGLEAARVRAREYRSTESLTTMIYLIGNSLPPGFEPKPT